jgi:hypothetical protein
LPFGEECNSQVTGQAQRNRKARDATTYYCDIVCLAVCHHFSPM